MSDDANVSGLLRRLVDGELSAVDFHDSYMTAWRKARDSKIPIEHLTDEEIDAVFSAVEAFDPSLSSSSSSSVFGMNEDDFRIELTRLLRRIETRLYS